MTGRPVNIAIIGTGLIAETRARAYAGVTGYEPRLVAAVSRSQERVQAYGRRHGIADTYADYARVLERPDVDVVDLCVPNYLHRPMTEAAAQAGKHVICSKPLTAFDGSALGPGSRAVRRSASRDARGRGRGGVRQRRMRTGRRATVR